MSKIVAPWALAQTDMSALVYSDYLPDVPRQATWWRQRMFRGPDGNVYTMQIDNIDNPTRVEIAWWDGGLDETIEPYAMKISAEEPATDYSFRSDSICTLSSDLRPVKYLDVLYVGVPTGAQPPQLKGGYSGRWEILAGYSHIHPDDRAMIMQMRAERRVTATSV